MKGLRDISSLIDRKAMLLLCNIIVNEGIARGVLPVLNAVLLF
jgi:hypothetical protein